MGQVFCSNLSYYISSVLLYFILYYKKSHQIGIPPSLLPTCQLFFKNIYFWLGLIQLCRNRTWTPVISRLVPAPPLSNSSVTHRALSKLIISTSISINCIFCSLRARFSVLVFSNIFSTLLYSVEGCGVNLNSEGVRIQKASASGLMVLLRQLGQAYREAAKYNSKEAVALLGEFQFRINPPPSPSPFS